VKISYLDFSEARELYQVYNAQVAEIPHCYSVSKDEFIEGICKPHENLYSQKIITGEEDGKTVGFSHVTGIKVNQEGQKENQGLIRFLTYQRGYRPVGQALLKESEKYLMDLGETQVKAFRVSYSGDCCYRFYHLGFGLVSDRVTHICSLFRMNGYQVTGGEMFMEQPGYNLNEPTPPESDVEIIVDRKSGRGALPNLSVQAVRSGKEVGICESRSMGEYCQAEDAQNWIFIKWLGVEEGKWGKGWGRYLLRRNLWEAQELGYKNTAISANIRNYRAHLFYTNYGYKVVDTTYEFTKEASQ
jgi:GNAT superfamily N-acetyltransferase